MRRSHWCAEGAWMDSEWMQRVRTDNSGTWVEGAVAPQRPPSDARAERLRELLLPAPQKQEEQLQRSEHDFIG